MRNTLFVMGIICLSICGYGQNSVKELRIGDQLPDLVIGSLINYNKSEIKTSDFKGKLLILDFWATWCTPCIAAFPKLDSLQKAFGNNLQILPVTTERKNDVINFLGKLKALKSIQVVSVTEDKVLSKLFYHLYLPHYVWIDKTGKIVAFTDAKSVTKQNIEAALNNDFSHLTMKNDGKIDIVHANTSDFLFIPTVFKIQNDKSLKLERLPGQAVALYSVFSNYIDGLGPGQVDMSDSTHLVVTNMPALILYKIAFLGNDVKVLNYNSVKLDIDDSLLRERITTERSKYNSNAEYQLWVQDNTYCYEIKTPRELAKKINEIMLRDLNNYFGTVYGIEGAIENRKTKYLALTRVDRIDKLASKGGEAIDRSSKLSIKIVNGRIANLLGDLAVPLQDHPVAIDETNYKGKIDLEINCQLSDLKALNIELNKYGLQLIEKQKIMPIGVIRIVKDNKK